MAVAPDFGGRGLGRALVQAVLDLARSTDGVQQVGLTVSEGNNPAIALYERCGFTVWGTESCAVIVVGAPISKLQLSCP